MDPYLSIKHPWVDSTEAPLYRVTFPITASEDQLRSYCQAVENWAAKVRYPVGWVMDLSLVSQVSAQQRATFAKYMEGMKAFDERYTRACALILPGALLRGVATAIFWLYRPPFQHRTFADFAEGHAWARDALTDPV